MNAHDTVPLAAAARAAPVHLRSMEDSDVVAVVRLERASFSMPWSPETFRSLLERAGTEAWVSEREGEGVIGYYVLWCVRDQAEIANIAVDERFRGRGVGALLLDHALARAGSLRAESVFLEVRASNVAARALYDSRGFQPIGVRRGYYERPREDAHLLVLHLAGRDPTVGGL